MKYYLGCLLNTKAWLLLAVIDTAFWAAAFEKYIFSDIGYLKWLMIAMFVDLVTGITKVWVKEGWECITSKGLRDTVSKCVQYGAFLIITNVLTHFEIGGENVNVNFLWINKIAYEFLILIECKSVYENLVKINPQLDFVKLIFEKMGNLLKNKEIE